MLRRRICYAFLTCRDEVIFLKLDFTQRYENKNVAPPYAEPRIEQVKGPMEVWIHYSDPIKHTDVLDETKGTVPVLLALLYMFHESTVSNCSLPENLELWKYLVTVKAGEKWKPAPIDLSL